MKNIEARRDRTFAEMTARQSAKLQAERELNVQMGEVKKHEKEIQQLEEKQQEINGRITAVKKQIKDGNENIKTLNDK